MLQHFGSVLGVDLAAHYQVIDIFHLTTRAHFANTVAIWETCLAHHSFQNW
jgi:hypothetical protein